MMLLVQLLAVAVSAVLASPAIPAIPEDYSRSANNYGLSDRRHNYEGGFHKIFSSSQRHNFFYGKVDKRADSSPDVKRFVAYRHTQHLVIVPQKRAALVLDRLLVALQKALHEEGGQGYDMDRDGPRTAPLRISGMDTNDLSALQRRGQGSGRGRVLRCYFNAVTCF